MLEKNITDFIAYCKEYNFSKSAITTFSGRLGEFDCFLKSINLNSFKKITYTQLADYVISGKSSEHTKKARVWTLHQFFQYLKVTGVFLENIAIKLPYPIIEKKDPDCLTALELNRVITHFIQRIEEPNGKRDLLMVLFFAFLGLRISTVVALNIQDINLKESSALIFEKGGRKRTIPIPQIICSFLFPYLKDLNMDLGPLFLSKKDKRISTRSIQHVFTQTSELLGFRVHSHLFRHTAATHINRVAGLDVTKQILGHKRRESTERYVHLNPDVYVEYMRRHPFMSLPTREV